MRPSRGMGAIMPTKMGKPKRKARRDDTDFTEYKKGGEVWDKPRPKGLGKPKKLSTAKKASAKAMAKAAGRPYPNLVDNMRAAKK
jgi:hypothetical protein|tara:strand:- start:722 stop:976 length:255 start_codon:yes stop_codon:yes gene_type:complete